MNYKELNDIIASKWEQTVRFKPKDEGNLIGLPYPYIVPCLKGHFQELYYWDTYFASRGLALHGQKELVKNCCDDFIHEIELFGFIPNGSRTFYLSRSQPPYFGAQIAMVYELYGDKEWLEKAVAALEKEYKFWMEKRILPLGLQHYGHHAEEEMLLEFYEHCCVRRLGSSATADKTYMLGQGAHTCGEAESGWDFNPRFERRCLDYVAIDLNSLMYYNENLLADFHRELGNDDRADEWLKLAEVRKSLINQYCWDEERGVFLDYDTREDKVSPVLSMASLQPLWAGLATEEQAASTVKAMEKYLEFDHGLSTCEKNDSGITYQWDYPNGWPCLQMIAMDALKRYGFEEETKRIAKKYLDTVLSNYESTGDIWEKYNVVTGTTEVQNEYDMPAMMGWSAGAFAVALSYFED